MDSFTLQQLYSWEKSLWYHTG